MKCVVDPNPQITGTNAIAKPSAKQALLPWEDRFTQAYLQLILVYFLLVHQSTRQFLVSELERY